MNYIYENIPGQRRTDVIRPKEPNPCATVSLCTSPS